MTPMSSFKQHIQYRNQNTKYHKLVIYANYANFIIDKFAK